MRLRRVVARVALIAALALVAVPGSAGSQAPSEATPIDEAIFHAVDVSTLVRGTVAAPPTLDPAYRSDGTLDLATTLTEPVDAPVVLARADIDQPEAKAGVVVVPAWRYDPEISFYGPGFYGRRTACGLAYTTTILGVAHRSLPCGTMVTFRNGSRTVTIPVIDRGPYVAGRTWDLSGAACKALRHCYTGPIYWKFPG